MVSSSPKSKQQPTSESFDRILCSKTTNPSTTLLLREFKALCLPRNLEEQVSKVARLPRNLYLMQQKCRARHEIRTSGYASHAPGTKSALLVAKVTRLPCKNVLTVAKVVRPRLGVQKSRACHRIDTQQFCACHEFSGYWEKCSACHEIYTSGCQCAKCCPACTRRPLGNFPVCGETAARPGAER